MFMMNYSCETTDCFGASIAILWVSIRALQHAPQTTWRGKGENVAAAQRAFSHRAKMNSLATLGQWKADMEKKAA